MKRRGRYSCVNPQDPRAAGVCDRGGEVRRRDELVREMRWAGNRLVPTGFLCCRDHIDPPHPLDRTLILQPDPVAILDPRPMLDPLSVAPPLPPVDPPVDPTDPPVDPEAPVPTLDADFILDRSRLT